MSLSTFRKKLDKLDRQLLEILAERLKVSMEAASYKMKVGMSVRDASREKLLLASREKIAEEMGLSPKFVHSLFSDLMAESRRLQREKVQKTFKNVRDVLKVGRLRYKEKSLAVALPIWEIFKRVYANYDNTFFLESLGEDADFSRYSYIGFDPYCIISARNNLLFVDKEATKVPNPFFALRVLMNKVNIKKSTFCGGLVGYLSYDAVKYFEEVCNFGSHPNFPSFEFGFYLDGLVFHKQSGKLKYFYLKEDRSGELLDVINQSVSFKPFQTKYLGTDTKKAEFIKMVQKAKDHIHSGNSFQIVLSRKKLFETKGSPIYFYERLREINPSPHMFYLKFGERELVGSSPELIVRLENFEIENYPLAGTRKRGKILKEDKKIAENLLKNEKEVAEHMMLVDLGRNDTGKVSEFGSVCVRKLMDIRRFSHVQHMGSDIVGKKKKERDMFDVLAASSPMGTVSGAPKIETMKIIDSLEKGPRGPYAGSVGFFSFNSNCNFAVAIRSLFKYNNSGYIQAGAGVVYDSVPAEEFLETERKMKGLMTALG